MKSGDASQTISYNFRAKSSDTTATTAWSFDVLSTTKTTTKTVGIYVEDYSGKPAGTYNETVTFTAEIKSSIVYLSTITGAYTAQDGDILTGKATSSNIYITVAAGAEQA